MLAALTLAGSLGAFLAPAAANAADPTYGGFVIDGDIPDDGLVPYGDPFGAVDELGPEQADNSEKKLGVIHDAAVPMLGGSNPNVQTDLANVWLETSAEADGIWLYFAWERDTDNGSGVVMYEFQEAAKPAGCAYETADEDDLIAGCNPWANRQAGDFVIVWDWSGSSTAIVKRTFVASGGGLVLDAGVTLGAQDAKAVYSDDKLRGEAAINLSTTVFPEQPTGCTSIANVIPGTLTSNSDTADFKDAVLSDFGGTSISNCGSVEVTKQTSPSGQEGSFPVSASRTSGDEVRFDGSTSAVVTLDGDDDVETIADLLPGTDYRLGETVPAGWELLSVSCDGGATDIATTGTFAVVAGEVTSCTVTNKKAMPSIEVTKTATPPSTGLSVGDDVVYTVTVENTGNVTLSSVTASDPRCQLAYASGDTGDDSLLQEDETWTYTCTYEVTQVDVDTGSVLNTATGGAFYGQTRVEDDDDETVYTLSTPSIDVEKSAAPGSGLGVDDEVLYTVTVDNDGTVTLSDVTVTDPLCALVYQSGDDGDGVLQVEETWTYQCTYTVAQDDVDAGGVKNTAEGSASYGDTEVTDDDTVVVTTRQNPSIDVQKGASPDSGLQAGEPVLYTVTVDNDGDVTLSDVTVDDPRCDLLYHSGDDGDGQLQVDETWTYTCTYAVTQADVDAGGVENTAEGSAFFGDTEVTDDDTVVVTTLQDPQITVDKTADPASGLAAGDVVGYEVTVENSGNVTLSDVTVDDPICTLVYGSGDDGDGLLQVTETWLFTCGYEVTQADVDAGSVLNTADGSAFFGETEVTDDGSALITMPQGPEISVDKLAEPVAGLQVGDEVLYTVTVDNSGNVTLTDVTVEDPLCEPVYHSGDDGDELLQVDETWTYLCTYAITQTDVDAGSVVNTADGSALFGDSEVTDDGTAVVTTLQDPSIAVGKTATPDTGLDLDDVVLYTVTVENDGDVTLSDVAVEDPLCELAYLSGDDGDGLLQVDETWTYTCTYVVTQADVDAGEVTNTAVGTAQFGDTEVSDDGTAVVTVPQAPALGLTKSADKESYSTLGEVITYTYVVTNTGNVTLAGPFTVTDDKTPVTCPATQSLTVGASITCTATYTVTAADMEATGVTNVARALNGTVTSPPATVTVDHTAVLGGTVPPPTPTPPPTPPPPAPAPAPAPAETPRVLPFTGAWLLPILVTGSVLTVGGVVLSATVRRKRS